MKLKPVQKAMIELLTRLSKLPHFRAEPWVLNKREIALIGRWSASMVAGEIDGALPYSEHMADVLLMALSLGYVRIERAHEHEGLAWLWSQHKFGWLGTKELNIMRQFDKFTLCGFQTKKLGLRYSSVPIYKVHALNGDTFSYAAWSWQSGVSPLIVQ
jgi:hypothetical protein